MSLCDGSEMLFVVMSVLSPSLLCDLMQLVGKFSPFADFFVFCQAFIKVGRQTKFYAKRLNIIKKG